MSSLQICLLGVVLAWTPSLIFLACIFYGGHRRALKANQKSLDRNPESAARAVYSAADFAPGTAAHAGGSGR